MVTLNKIVTKQGDGGLTRLATGEERHKDDARVEAYGAVDEANAAIGVARAQLSGHALDADLERIQNDLFDVGADLSTPGPDAALGFEPLRVVQDQISWLEQRIDALNEGLPELKSFVLPAGPDGDEATARLHMARTIVRRAERRAVTLSREDPAVVNALASVYLNRLSDFLFVACRAVAHERGGETLWVPAAGRTT